MKKTKIDWADSTWNPVTGCLNGCDYCYARRIAERFRGFAPEDGNGDWNTIQYCKGGPRLAVMNGLQARKREDGKVVPAVYPFGFTPTLHRYRLDEPRRWKKPRTIFVCSMADLFGDWVPDEWIEEVFQACESAPWHRYLFLTKNPKRFGQINGWNHQYNNEYAKDNMWFGTTITGQHELNRIRDLPYGDAHTFLSIEPILGRIDLDGHLPASDTRWQCSYCGHYAKTYANHCDSCGHLGGYSGSFRKQPVNWIILGAETGNRKNRVTPQRSWIDGIVRVCDEHGIPVFMKKSLRELMGDDLRQEFPWEVSPHKKGSDD